MKNVFKQLRRGAWPHVLGASACSGRGSTEDCEGFGSTESDKTRDAKLMALCMLPLDSRPLHLFKHLFKHPNIMKVKEAKRLNTT